MDILTPQKRHAIMAAIHGKDTKPEILVRKWLWNNGFRYRLNHPQLPGKPDIVMRKYKTCIFVNGCFWHGHGVNPSKVESSACCRIPKTNTEFWITKILRNQEHDSKVKQQLAFMGWNTITIWECQLKPILRQQTLESLAYTLNSIFLKNYSIKSYKTDEEESMMVAEDLPVYGDR